MHPDAVAALNGASGDNERSVTLDILRTTLRLLESHPTWNVRHALARATDSVCLCPRCVPYGAARVPREAAR